MDTRINYKWISDYSEQFAIQVTNRFFDDKNRITGQEILNLTEIKQINLFVIKLLFQEWKDEINRLKSPYFDYQETEVKEIMKELMNTLSRHIVIEKNDFLPLFINAVEDTLLIIFSPYDYYKRELNRKSRLSTSEIKEIAKYIKVNKYLINSLLDKIEHRSIKEISPEEGLNLLNEILETTQEIPEDINHYISKFSDIVHLNSEKIYSEATHQENNSTSFSNQQEYSAKPEEPKKSSADYITLNDQFVKNERSSLADLHQKKKIHNIREKITINQRFMFINELFGGNNEEYHKMLDQLDNFTTYDDAINYLQQNYVHQHNWDMESEEVGEFLDVVSKKFD